MPKKWCRLFPGMPWQVSEARRFVAGLLADEGKAVVEDAELVVGELASNAVRHTRSGWYRGWFLVIVGFSDDTVRIEVIDQGSDDEPLVRSVRSPVEEGGRGLLLIAACAENWGVKDRPGGRCIWADLARVSG
ncbi:ATP-binding protein [Streptomyces sp. A012304]|uniref:ATP-binding protein n=1 Tax=Streptomyces sp. A012304 TaxID=375446 RepID=UPI002231B13B|nr:ATP-binding protein [Streptomyces sp. A012304]GKQ34033.1 ATP-binding protein [Streptomyces sp. A012304]